MAGSETQASVFETLCERLSIADPTRLLAREHLRALAASSEQDPCSCVCVLYLASAAMEQPPLPLPLLLHAANVRYWPSRSRSTVEAFAPLPLTQRLLDSASSLI